MILRKFISILTLVLSVAAVAQQVSIDEVKAMIRRGDLEDATAALDSIGRRQPRNADVDLLRGRMLMAEFNDSAAIVALTSAQKKGSNDALLDLAEIATRQYRVDDADDLLARYQNYIARRKKLTDESGTLDERISRTRTMLDRVEDIVVFDSIVVDAEEFFKAFPMAPDAGRLLSADRLPSKFKVAEDSPVYLTEDGRKMLWADTADSGNLVIKSADALLDNEWSDAENVGDFLSLGGDANYPFLMPDGVTLYYASNGEGSIGGYDIFISRDNGNGFLEPQNIGMPYNSPYDDYMLAIDEVTGAGWWATDRNHIPGCVTIYQFVPSEMRKNVSVDDPRLIDRALLSDISLTQPEGSDFSRLRKAIRDNSSTASKPADDFKFYLPDGRVITSMHQVSDNRAANALSRYIESEKSVAELREKVDALRQRWAAGDKSASATIKQLEQQLKTKLSALQSQRNEAIKALSR